MKNEIKVVVTGAAGQIGYSLIPRLIDGNTFGDKTVNVSLVVCVNDVEPSELVIVCSATVIDKSALAVTE